MLNILVFTNLFPNPEQPLRGNFVESLVNEMGELAKVTVVSPIPWFPNFQSLSSECKSQRIIKGLNRSWHQNSKVPYSKIWNGFDVYYPKYPFIPVVGRPIHSALMTAGIYGLIKTLVREKKIDIINAHWIYPDGIAAALMGKLTGVPVMVTAHGCDINLYGNYRLRKPQVKWALQSVNTVTAVSSVLAEKIVNNFSINRKKVHVVHNGFDLNQFYQRDKIECRELLGLDISKKYLLFVGQLHEVKGLFNLIESLSILKESGGLDFDTILVGDGPLKNGLCDLIKNKGLEEKIHLVGKKPYYEIPIWMGASDVLCLPSKREGQPCVILEALGSGLPVVASRVGGIPELINENNGIMVSPENADELSEALIKGFTRVWDKADISRNIQHMTWENSAKKYINLFSEIVN